MAHKILPYNYKVESYMQSINIWAISYDVHVWKKLVVFIILDVYYLSCLLAMSQT